MTRIEEARNFYINEMKVDAEHFNATYSDEDVLHMYECLKETEALFCNETAELIKSIFNDRGEWRMVKCLNAVNSCSTWNGDDAICYRLRQCYRSNGTEKNVNFRLEVEEWYGNNGRILAEVKIPFNASEKVVRNRYNKIKGMIQG